MCACVCVCARASCCKKRPTSHACVPARACWAVSFGSTCSATASPSTALRSCPVLLPQHVHVCACLPLQRDRFTKHSGSFMREAEVLARLNHPNIIRMFGLVTEPSLTPALPGGSSLIAGIMMEHVRGGSLSQVRCRGRGRSGCIVGMRARARVCVCVWHVARGRRAHARASLYQQL